jgi:F-type H+-transporting ATPase subunit delta
MSVVAKRYARAIVQAVDEKNVPVNKVLHDLKAFEDLLAVSLELREALYNPAFQKERAAVLAGVLEHLHLDAVAASLLGLLVDNGRLKILSSIIGELRVFADERSGRLRAQVFSSFALSEPQTERLAKALEKRFGHPVLVAVHVEPEILGGLVCKVGDLTIDLSLKRQLEILRERLLEQRA